MSALKPLLPFIGILVLFSSAFAVCQNWEMIFFSNAGELVKIEGAQSLKDLFGFLVKVFQFSLLGVGLLFVAPLLLLGGGSS